MSGTPEVSLPPQASDSFIKELKLQSSLKGTYNLNNSDYPDSIKKQFCKVCSCLGKCQQFCLMGGDCLGLSIKKTPKNPTIKY